MAALVLVVGACGSDDDPPDAAIEAGDSSANDAASDNDSASEGDSASESATEDDGAGDSTTEDDSAGESADEDDGAAATDEAVAVEAVADGAEVSFDGELSAEAPAARHDVILSQGQVIRWEVGTQAEFDSVAAIAVDPDEFRSGEEEYLPFWTDAFSDAADPRLEVVIRDLPPDLRDLAPADLPDVDETFELMDMDTLLNGDEWVEAVPGVTDVLGDRVIVQGGVTGVSQIEDAGTGYQPCFIVPADGTYSIVVAAEDPEAYGAYVVLLRTAPAPLSVDELDVAGYLARSGTEPCFEAFE